MCPGPPLGTLSIDNIIGSDELSKCRVNVLNTLEHPYARCSVTPHTPHQNSLYIVLCCLLADEGGARHAVALQGPPGDRATPLPHPARRNGNMTTSDEGPQAISRDWYRYWWGLTRRNFVQRGDAYDRE